MTHLENPLAWNVNVTGKQDPKLAMEAKRKQYDIDLLYYTVFTTESGQALLDFLRKNTLEAATWMPSLAYEKAIAHGFAREGQNALVRAMVDGIEKIKKASTLEEYAKL